MAYIVWIQLIYDSIALYSKTSIHTYLLCSLQLKKEPIHKILSNNV